MYFPDMSNRTPLARRRSGIPLKRVTYDNQVGTAKVTWILMRLKYAGTCIHCGEEMPPGRMAEWNQGIGVRHEMCAWAYEKSQKAKENLFRAALVDDPEGFQKFTKMAKQAFESQPYNETMLSQMADYLFDTYEYESAIKVYSQISKKNPKSVYALVSMGAAYIRLEQFEKGKRCYLKALKIKPDDKEILDKLQRLYYRMGNYRKSIVILQKLSKQSVDYGEKLVETYYHTGEYEKAVKENTHILNFLEENKEKYPVSFVSALIRQHNYLVAIIRNETREREALKKINRHMKGKPEIFVKSIMIHFYNTFNKLDEANKIYREFLKLEIKSDYDLFSMIQVYLNQKNYRKVIEICEKNIKNQTLRYHLQYTLANTFSEIKKYEKSNNVISQMFAESENPDAPLDSEMMLLLAKNLEKMGNNRMALATLDKAAGLHDSTDALREIVRKLRKTEHAAKVLPYVEKLHKVEPKNFTISMEYVSVLIDTQSYQKALNIILKIEKEEKLGKEDKPVLLFKKAVCLFHIGETVPAHEIFKDLVMQDRKFKDALDGVALTSIKLGKRKLGLKAIREAEKIASSETLQDDQSDLPPARVLPKSERILRKRKNVVTKPSFRYNPDKKIADMSVVKTAVNAVCALLNSKGGVLRIGITGKTPTGIAQDLKLFGKNERTNQAFEEYIRKILGQRLSESETGKFVGITFAKIKYKIVCEVNVPLSKVPIYVKSRNKDEEFYVMKDGKPERLGPKQQAKFIRKNFTLD